MIMFLDYFMRLFAHGTPDYPWVVSNRTDKSYLTYKEKARENRKKKRSVLSYRIEL